MDITIKITLLLIFMKIFNESAYWVANAEYTIQIPVDIGSCANWSEYTARTTNSGTCLKINSTLQCYGSIVNFHESLEISLNEFEYIQEVIFCGWTNQSFDVEYLMKPFSSIRSLRIEHSNFTHIINDFPELNYLETINISWTKLNYTSATLFEKVKYLKVLDLRWNKLENFPYNLAKNVDSLFLAGNPWNCTKDLSWFLDSSKNMHIIDRDKLYCTDINYSGRPVLTVMQFKSNLNEACKNPELRNCSCKMPFVRLSDDGMSLQPLYSINCSNLNLYKLPSFIPKNTTIFLANNNKISNIEPLQNIYGLVLDIYLDYNLIESIDILDTAYWLQNFRIFSLKGNQLTKIPIYVFENALEKNRNALRVFFSENPWICDCLFTLRFRELLMKYNTIIKDSTNVSCIHYDEEERDDIHNQQVLALKYGDVCVLPTDYRILPLNLLNVTLSMLILFVMCKLAYDYWNYRKYGKLPWIATKLP